MELTIGKAAGSRGGGDARPDCEIGVGAPAFAEKPSQGGDSDRDSHRVVRSTLLRSLISVDCMGECIE